MTRTLIVGATGYLGRHLVAELDRRGHQVVAVARDRERAEQPGAWGSPALGTLVDEWRVGDVTDASFVDGLTAGVDHVVSALGVTRQNVDPWRIDHDANAAILQDALAHGVAGFTYTGVVGHEARNSTVVRAKDTFITELTDSAVPSMVVNPTGYFSDMTEVLEMARRGLCPLFAPDAHRINPIHGADLAAFIGDRVEAGEPGRWDVGGPDVFTWREIARVAFAAAGRTERVLSIPPGVLRPVLWVADRTSPRRADMVRFMTNSMLDDCLGEPTGTHHLADYFAARVSGAETASR